MFKEALTLSKDEREFLSKIIPWCNMIVDYTRDKHVFLRRKAYNIQPLIILTHIIIESQWGTHPISKPLYEKKDANNLTLFKVDKLWHGKCIEIGKDKYKSYQNYGHFASDYSDLVLFSNLGNIVKYRHLGEQIRELSKLQHEPLIYTAKIESLIEVHGLDKLFNN